MKDKVSGLYFDIMCLILYFSLNCLLFFFVCLCFVYKKDVMLAKFKSCLAQSTNSHSDYEIARALAEKVHREGVQEEMMARIQGRTNPQYR